jgi:hypothetical protein
MTTDNKYITKNQRLPQEIHLAFQETKSDQSKRDFLILELVNASWTFEAVASASGLTRERIRQIAKANIALAKEFNFHLGFDIPAPPLQPEPIRPVYIEPSPKTLERLLELQPYAQQVRANAVRYREEAEEYTALLDYARTVEKVTLYRLAKRLGITHGAIRFRLVRYGYMEAVSATSKVYRPIKKENRVAGGR